MAKIGLAYGHVAYNIGDIAINAGLAEMLTEAGLGSVDAVALLSHHPKLRERAMKPFVNADVRQIPRASSLAVTRDRASEISQLIGYLAEPATWWSDAGFEGVTTVIINSGEHLFEEISGENWTDLAWRSLPVFAAHAAGARVVIAPSTYGPVHSTFGDRLISLMTSSDHGWVARDVASALWLESRTGIVRPPVLDPAFFLKPIENQAPKEERPYLGIIVRLEEFGLRAGSARSGFVAAKAKADGFEGSTSYQLAQLFARKKLAEGWGVRIFVQTPNDRDLAFSLFDSLHETEATPVEVFSPVTIDDYRVALSQMDLLLTGRFHASILGWGVGVPSIGIYHPSHGAKMPGLYEMLRCGSLCVEVGERDPRSHLQEILAAERLALESMDSVSQNVTRLKAQTLEWLEVAVASRGVRRSDEELRLMVIGQLASRLEEVALPDLVQAASVKSSDITALRREITALKDTLVTGGAEIELGEPGA